MGANGLRSTDETRSGCNLSIDSHRRTRKLSLRCCSGKTEKIEVKQPFSNPMRRNLKHLKGMDQKTHPKPRNLAKLGSRERRRERRSPAADLARRRGRGRREIGERTTAAAVRARATWAKAAEEKETAARSPWARALCALRGVTGRSLCGTGRVR